jgi:DNA-binding PadR family transcriptional regulator
MNDLILLAALLDGPKHGYALKKWSGVITGRAEMHNNLVYPLLRRFVTEGWVSRHKAAGKRGQTREVYSLTSKGRRVLLDRLGEFGEKESASAEAFCLRTGMFSVLDPEKRLELVELRDKWLQGRAERLSAIARNMPLDEWSRETVGHLQRQAEAERKWLGRLRKLAMKAEK